MANPNNPHGFLFERNLAGGSMVLDRWKTTSNVSLSPGDPIVKASGRIKLAGATSTALFGVCVESVTAVAATTKSASFIPALPHYLWSGQVGSTVNMTSGLIGARYGIAGTTTGKIKLSTTATTSVAQIVGLKPGSAYGTYAELLFVIAKSSYSGILS
jgi:hypothetical protein